jgi:acyl-CoA hydrolase
MEACVEATLARVGKRLRLATPLGIGKPNPLLNAFYRRAAGDPTIDLHIFTALSLARPRAEHELERRLLEPIAARLWGDYPDLDYELARTAGRLPRNVRVLEFYFYAGKYLGNPEAQRDHIASNYTHVTRDLIDRGANVIAQQVCRARSPERDLLSLSSNPDLTLDLMRGFGARGTPCAVVGQVNQQLPFMFGDAVIDADRFDFLVDDPGAYHRPFATPKTAVSDAEYLIGLYASALIKDGGTLQIGIGSIGDALVYALKLRHEHNAVYRELLAELGALQRFGDAIDRIGGLGTFERGLFASSEMLVDGFMHLIEAGIVKRKVYDDVALQGLLNTGRIDERVTLATLDALAEAGAIEPALGAAHVAYLQGWGVLRPELAFEDGQLVTPDGERVPADLRHEASRRRIAERCLGAELARGCHAHAAFLLGPEAFYRWLRELPEPRLRAIAMRSVAHVNQLYGHEQLARLQRQHARFVNTAMMVTLSGAVVSDALEDGRVVSGVGGQYNFVAMAHALEGARSILQLRSTRTSSGELRSNVLWNYGHATIPRHLRDLVVTEYGIAELRGATDEETVQALLAVSDARFQPGLLAQAKLAGKLRSDFALPELHRGNLPERYAPVLARFKRRGLLPAYPFGSELSEQEIALQRALLRLKEALARPGTALHALGRALTHGGGGEDVDGALTRMGLQQTRGLREAAYRRLLSAALRAGRT